LHDITSGNINFKGQRVGAGTRSNEKMIENARKEAREKIKLLRAESSENSAEISTVRARMREVITQQKQLIGEAKRDNGCGGAERRKLITQIQMIFQDPIASRDPRMTVRDIIAEGLVINGVRDKAYINEKVYEILEVVGLVREHADRYPHEFSGGQRQRIGIARAVIMRPEMIIADEPISALDVSVQAQVINLLNDLRARFGLTILFIAHDLSVVKYFSDRIGVMHCGKLVEVASSEELFGRPLHPYTKSLLSAIPLPDPHYEKQRIRKTYNPLVEHDYSIHLPSMREIAPNHFVYCNDEEEERYKQQC
jgi:ABC-type oligopeptide transport system ATPase subunit